MWAYRGKWCIYRRHRVQDDDIFEVTIDDPYFDIFLEDVTQELEHRGDPIPDAIIEPETNPEPEVIENIDEELEIFSLKLEELNEAFHRLKEKIDNP